MSLEEDKRKITEGFFEGINISNIELYGFIKENYEAVKPIFPIVGFIISRLSAVTELTLNESVWDAEIIYRSALEGLIKLTFITSANEQERQQRIKEYWEDLCEVNQIKQSEQAKKSLSVCGDDQSLKLVFTPMVLSEEEENKIRSKWTRLERKKLKQKWSFSEMISSMAKIKDDITETPERILLGLGHNYRFASHISHADETGSYDSRKGGESK